MSVALRNQADGGRTLRVGGSCPGCGEPLSELHARLHGRECHRCRIARQEAETARGYLERVVASGDRGALEEAVGDLEDLLVRHGLPLD